MKAAIVAFVAWCSPIFGVSPHDSFPPHIICYLLVWSNFFLSFKIMFLLRVIYPLLWDFPLAGCVPSCNPFNKTSQSNDFDLGPCLLLNVM